MKKLWAKDEGKSPNDVLTEDDLYGTNDHLRVTCPVGGSYVFGRVGEKPRCSMPGHTI